MERNYLPDSYYSTCGDDCKDKCNNIVFSKDLQSYVHAPHREKVFCPFGINNSMNQSIFTLQSFPNTKFGRVPQFDPRPLTKIGLELRKV